MFENKIQNNNFAGSLADCMFHHVSGSDYDGDNSLLCTLRVLLPSRMKENDHINVEHSSILINSESKNNAENELRNIMSGINKLYIINVRPEFLLDDDEDNIKKIFHEITPTDEWHEYSDVSEFFKSKMECRAFVNEEARSTAIVILNLNIKKYHLMQCIVPKMFPWYFDKGRVTMNERDLLFSLKDRYSTDYIRLLETFALSDDFIAKKASYSFIALKKRINDRRKANCENIIARIKGDIASYEAYILDKTRKLNDENAKLSGILCALNSKDTIDDQLSQYLQNTKDIEITDTNDTSINFIVKGYLDVFDPDSYHTLSRNVSSWYWSINTNNLKREFWDVNNRKILMDSIFSSNPIFKIKTCSRFSLDIEGNYARASSHYTYPEKYKDHYPNPHHYYNSCLGSYRSQIDAQLRNGNLIGAFSYCVMATHSVNVKESASFQYLCRDLFTTNASCLVDKDGKSYTPTEAYVHLVNLKTEKNNETEQGE